MPLKHGDAWNLDEDPISRSVFEVARLLDDQSGHLGGKDDALSNETFAVVSREMGQEPVEFRFFRIFFFISFS